MALSQHAPLQAACDASSPFAANATNVANVSFGAGPVRRGLPPYARPVLPAGPGVDSPFGTEVRDHVAMTEVSSLTGRLLVATPALADPNFDRAVVLLLD